MDRPFFFLSFLIPTLLLVSALSHPEIQFREAYAEVFADEHTWLDLSFPVDPHGFFQNRRRQTQVSVHGVLATDSGQVAVTGVWSRQDGEESYLFSSPGRQWRAKVVRGEGTCDAVLELSTGGGIRRLPARFCRTL